MFAASVKPKAVQVIDGSSDEGNAATPVVSPVATKKANGKKTDPSSVLKKRRSSTSQAPSTQKNTLDSWFGVAKKPAPKKKEEPVKEVTNDSDDFESTTPARIVHKMPAKTVNGSSPSKPKHKSKKLLQRRILLGDQCRVCDSAKTESSMRCERKCMDCEMTVHMSCYGVEEDEEMLPEKWRCRPCQANYDLTQETPEQDNEDGDTTTRGIPIHEPRGEGGRYHGLYSNSDFASVFLFIKRFRRLGLKLGVEITINTLAAALLAPREDHVMLHDLHIRLLQNIGTTISKTHNWVENLIRFLKASEYSSGAELVRRLAASGNANDWLSTYYDVSVADRVAILKFFCEAQFDENDILVEKIGKEDTSPESLRDDPLGRDASKRTYYLLEDPPTFADGTAWLCRCQGYDGSNWETVADDLPSLQSFVEALSYSTETADLQLWQLLSSRVLKSMERREKKKAQQAQRMNRMPRLLGNSGLDSSSILSTGRSLRTRRAVNYRSYVSDEGSDAEESEAEMEEEGEDEDDDEPEHEEDGGRGSPSRKRRRLREEQPTRSSGRLRGSLPTRSSRRQARNADSGSESPENHDQSDNDEDQNEESDASA